MTTIEKTYTFMGTSFTEKQLQEFTDDFTNIMTSYGAAKEDVKNMQQYIERAMFQGQASPRKLRIMFTKVIKPKKDAIMRAWVGFFIRGMKFANYADKKDDSAKYFSELLTELQIKTYRDGAQANRITVGQLLAMFPEYGVAVAKYLDDNRDGINFNGNKYPGPLPAVYCHPAGFAVMPFEGTDDQFELCKKAFMHYQNWYIEIRAKSAALQGSGQVSYRKGKKLNGKSGESSNEKREPATAVQKEDARKRSTTYLNLQKTAKDEDRWPADFKEDVLRDIRMDKDALFKRLKSGLSTYDFVKNMPDPAILNSERYKDKMEVTETNAKDIVFALKGVNVSDLTEQQARNLIAAFTITGDDISEPLLARIPDEVADSKKSAKQAK